MYIRGTPKLILITGREIGEEDAPEGSSQGDVCLKSKLPGMAQKPILEENQAEDGPSDGNTQRLQLVPHQE